MKEFFDPEANKASFDPFSKIETTTLVEYPVGGYAPGSYQNNCYTCQQDFIGDKYSRQCEACGINSVNKKHNEYYKKYNDLKNSVSIIINEITKIKQIL